MDDLLTKLRHDFPHFSFSEGSQFTWHAGKKHISYQKTGSNTKKDTWALLHELGHALLGHRDYERDIELLQLEVAAWDKARELAQYYALKIDENHIEDCLDTYRDWLHLRSTCPNCLVHATQTTPTEYHCFNCQTTWSVTRERLCRPYRLQKELTITSN